MKWGTNIPATSVAFSNSLRLLGLVHGHWDTQAEALNAPMVDHVDQGVNVGLAIVVPASQILEVLNQKALVEMRSEIKVKELSKHQNF